MADSLVVGTGVSGAIIAERSGSGTLVLADADFALIMALDRIANAVGR